MRFLDIRAFIIKIPASATSIFLNFYVIFMNYKSGLQFNGSCYVLIFNGFPRNQVDNITAATRQIALDIIKPPSNFALKLITYQIIFQMPHFIQDFTQLSLFLGLAGTNKGDQFSFRCFSILNKILMDLDGKSFFIMML